MVAESDLGPDAQSRLLSSLITTPKIRTSLFTALVWFLRPNKLMLKRECYFLLKNFLKKKKKKKKKSNDVLSYLSDMAKEGTVSVASESHGYLGADMWSTLLIHSLTLRMPKELTCAMRVTTYR